MGRMTAIRFGSRGQITLSFNWIFVLIAGAIILLFFVGLIVKQKQSSEQKLDFDVVNILETILVGSTVSEHTINTIDTSGISDKELVFECELDSSGGYLDIFSNYGIIGSSASIETAIQVIMSPEIVQSKELILWSLPYKLPFKIMDFLILTGQSNQYYVFGGAGTSLREELQEVTSSFNIDFITSTAEISEIGANKHVRIIDLDGSYVAQDSPVPIVLSEVEDDLLDAIVLGIGGYDIYQKEGSSFSKVNLAGQIPIISLFNSERDAAVISAMFSESQENYQCNMMKAFKRMELLVQVYQGKAKQLSEFYGTSSVNYDSECLLWLDDEKSSDDVVGNLQTLGVQLTSCVARGYESCIDALKYAERLLELNNELDNAGCVKLY